MEYLEITISTTHEFSEMVALTLMELGCEGVSIYDRQDLIDLESTNKSWDYIEDSLLQASATVLVCGCFTDLSDKQAILAELENQLNRIKNITPFNCGSLEISTRLGDDADWLANFKKFFQPIETQGLIVVAPWITMQHNKPKIIIDPSMAFGTGTHETTRMCLEFIQSLDIKGKTVLDLGCGSGILGLSSLVLGAKLAYLLDYDENSIKCSQHNAKLNNLTNYEVKQNDLLTGIDYAADIVLANLTASLLQRAVADIFRIVQKGGFVVVSGIIEGKQDEVEELFVGQGFRKLQQKSLGDWHAFVFQK